MMTHEVVQVPHDGVQVSPEAVQVLEEADRWRAKQYGHVPTHSKSLEKREKVPH